MFVFLHDRGVPRRVTVFLGVAREELLGLNHIFFPWHVGIVTPTSISFARGQFLFLTGGKVKQKHFAVEEPLAREPQRFVGAKETGKYLFRDVISEKCKVEIHRFSHGVPVYRA